MNALAYYGGKAQIAPWIAAHLPSTSLYVEPFAGMCSVLLSREPSHIEIINDLNGDIILWWRVLTERTDEFARKVSLTAKARSEFDRAKAALRQDDLVDLERAWAIHTVLQQGFSSRTDDNPSWSRSINPSIGSIVRRWMPERFHELAARMMSVQMECQPAEDLLETLIERPEATIYADPPYPSANRCYAHNEVDIDALSALFLAQKGNVCISGYDGEWDHLGLAHCAAKHAFSSQHLVWQGIGSNRNAVAELRVHRGVA